MTTAADFLDHKSLASREPISSAAHPIHEPVHRLIAELQSKYGGRTSFGPQPTCPVVMVCHWDTAERIGDEVKFGTSSFSYHIDDAMFEYDTHLQKSPEAIADYVRPLVESLLTNRLYRTRRWDESYERYAIREPLPC